ncbi:hypothetical protein CRENBAI_018350 [Crenichthys baileyi]|uniref:Uncharacterized protein n=1 Tax=Crenichthys baileyi TaxID=28760 RepID=A0AAV9RIT5_9TELE
MRLTAVRLLLKAALRRTLKSLLKTDIFRGGSDGRAAVKGYISLGKFNLEKFTLKGESKKENLCHFTCVKFSPSKERDLFRLALQCLLGNPGMCGMGDGGASAVI